MAGKIAYTIDPLAEPLTGAVGRAAVNGQVFEYPKVTRNGKFIDPIIPDQRFGLLSYQILEKPYVVTKDGKTIKILGFCKARGNYPNEDEARRLAAKLVREVESVFPVGICPVGIWQPIVEDLTDVSHERVSINAAEDAEKVRVQEASRRERMKKVAEDRSAIENQKREANLKRGMGTDAESNPNSLDYAITHISVWIKLFRERMELKAKLKDIESKLKQRHETLEYYRRSRPEFFDNDAWLERMNEERHKVSVPREVLSPSERSAFEKRIETTRLPPNMERKPINILIDLEGKDTPENREKIYPEYEEDYAILPGDSPDDKAQKAVNLQRYREKVERAAKGDRYAMAAVCPWRLDGYGRVLDAALVIEPTRMAPGTEDLKITLPSTENLPEAPSLLFDLDKLPAQETFDEKIKETTQEDYEKNYKGLMGDVSTQQVNAVRAEAEFARKANDNLLDEVPLPAAGWMDYSVDHLAIDQSIEPTPTRVTDPDIIFKGVEAFAVFPKSDGSYGLKVWYPEGNTDLLKVNKMPFMDYPKEWSEVTITPRVKADVYSSIGEATVYKIFD